MSAPSIKQVAAKDTVSNVRTTSRGAMVFKKPGETDEECIKRHGHPINEGGLLFLIKESNGMLRYNYRAIQPIPGVPRIIGDGFFPDAPAFYDVRDALQGFSNVVLNAHRASQIHEDIPAGSIIYNLEHIIPAANQVGLFRSVIEFLNTLKTGRFVLWDYQRGNVEYLRTLGIKVRHIPFGYHPCFERVTPVAQDIDVLFFGTLTPRRERVLNAIKRAGIQHKFVFQDGLLYGSERDQLIARAKIIVNLHRIEKHPLEVVRINYLLANKCFVISERGNDEVENMSYEDALVFVDYTDVVSTCIEYLSKDREVIASRGREIIRARPMEQWL